MDLRERVEGENGELKSWELKESVSVQKEHIQGKDWDYVGNTENIFSVYIRM